MDILYCLHGPPVNKGASKDIFVCYITNRGIYTIDADKRISLPYDELPPSHKGEIAQIRSTSDSKYVLVGIPSTSSLVLLSFNRTTLLFTFVKRLQLSGFRTFEADRDLTYLVVMNAKSRVIDHYAVKWTYDTQQANKKGGGKQLKEVNEDEMIEALRGLIVMPSQMSGRLPMDGADPLSVAAGGGNKTSCCIII